MENYNQFAVFVVYLGRYFLTLALRLGECRSSARWSHPNRFTWFDCSPVSPPSYRSICTRCATRTVARVSCLPATHSLVRTLPCRVTFRGSSVRIAQPSHSLFCAPCTRVTRLYIQKGNHCGNAFRRRYVNPRIERRRC